jgi:glucose-1-phosphate thymidylyltransferase
MTITKAVVLARGLGTRMRLREPEGGTLTSAQAATAARGVKAMIPLSDGRPFLDHVLAGLAEAGIETVCLVIGPEHDDIRATYGERRAARHPTISFAIQTHAVGTANAVLAAEPFAAGDDFLVMNSDNYYPVTVLRALCRATAPALPAFSRDGLLRDGYIPADRIARYALLDIAPDGTLARIVEKPDAETLRAFADARVSMNCWSFTPAIFAACRAVPQSSRGEYELPLAVQFAIDRLQLHVHTFPVDAAVLDLSHQSDIAGVSRVLAATPAQP